MGKKARQKKKEGPAARGSAAPGPAVDLTTVDTTICAVCKEKLPPPTWRGTGSFRRTCCGSHFCVKCAPDFGKEDTAAEDYVPHLCANEDSPNDAGSAEERMPDLILIAQQVIKPCPICNSAPPQSQKDFIRGLQRCADAGQASAQYDLANCLTDGGRGVQKDERKALKLFRQAANQGHTMAQAILMDSYMKEDRPGGPDYVSAKHWAEKCCDANAVAQNCLGHLYANGFGGVPKDVVKAAELLRKSAEQGYPPGILHYAVSCTKVARFAEALEWFVKGGTDETDLILHQRAIAECQYRAAHILYTNSELENIVASNFWAQRAKRNGLPDADRLCKILNDVIWRACACCGNESPKDRCNACRGAAYCSGGCQVRDWPRHKQACRELPKIIAKPMKYSSQECSFCGVENYNDLKQCGRCNGAYYCDNNDCQKQHWPIHRGECKDARKAAKAAASAAAVGTASS